jgi:class 3 adenylate cyclase
VALWGPDDAEERLAVATEMLELAEKAGEKTLALHAHGYRLVDLLELGDPEGVDAEVAAYSRLAEESREPMYLRLSLTWKGTLALLRGQLEEAEQLIPQAFAVGRRVQEQDAVQVFGSQMLSLRREQGRTAEVEPAVKQFVEEHPAVPWQSTLAAVYADLGHEAEARRVFDEVAANDFTDIPRDVFWLVALALLSEACAFLQDSSRAEQLYALLAPYAGRCIVSGYGMTSLGSASRNLGILATTAGRFDEAAQHFECAIRENSRTGARPWVARTQYEYATMLLDRGAPGDRSRAFDLLNRALESAGALGMKQLVEKAVGLKALAQGVQQEGTRSSIDVVATEVEREPPDLIRHAGPDGNITVLFADIAGFGDASRREQRFGPAPLDVYRTLVSKELAIHGGVEVRSHRDGFMLAFPNPHSALDCALAIQRVVAVHNEHHPESTFQVRTGLHTGAAIAQAKRLVAATLRPAARIAQQARGGEVLVSAGIRRRAAGGGIRFDRGRTVRLEGVPRPQRIFRAEPELPAEGNVFRCQGEYWTIAYEGRVIRLRDCKGLRYLGQLLQHPNREFPALDLAAFTVPTGYVKDQEAPRLAPASAGPVLDGKAKAEYRRRLIDLREELEEAEHLNDLGRATSLREEIEALAGQLAAGLGLGGRDREAVSAAERARVAVTLRIKDAVRKIRSTDPDLADHLSRSVKTGRFCSYTPDPSHPISWAI